MVKVEYMKDQKVREWYWKTIRNMLGKKRKPSPKNKLEKIWAERLSDCKIMYDIIFEELSVLVLKYEWIKEYVDKCKKNDYVAGNNIISQYINADMLSKEIRLELIERMGVRVCPYCNQQYIYAIRFYGDDGRYLGDLDHVLPKKAYPLFALSLWNLIPACKSCNQLFKRDQQKEILSPIEAGFGEDCILKIKYRSINAIKGASQEFEVKWEISDGNDQSKRKQKIANNIDVFKLNELYEGHKSEIQLILWKKAVYSNKVYQNSIKRMLNVISGGKLEMENFLFGIDLSKQKFGEQPHAKMIYDIVKYN